MICKYVLQKSLILIEFLKRRLLVAARLLYEFQLKVLTDDFNFVYSFGKFSFELGVVLEFNTFSAPLQLYILELKLFHVLCEIFVINHYRFVKLLSYRYF